MPVAFTEGDIHNPKILKGWNETTIGQVPHLTDILLNLDPDYYKAENLHFMNSLKSWKNAFCSVPGEYFQDGNEHKLEQVKELQTRIKIASLGVIYESLGYSIESVNLDPIDADENPANSITKISTQITGLAIPKPQVELYDGSTGDYLPTYYMTSYSLKLLREMREEADSQSRQEIVDSGNFFCISPLSSGIGLGFAVFLEKIKNHPNRQELINNNFGFSAAKRGYPDRSQTVCGIELNVMENIFKKVSIGENIVIGIDVVDDVAFKGRTFTAMVREIYGFLKSKTLPKENLVKVLESIRFYTSRQKHFSVNVYKNTAHWDIVDGNDEVITIKLDLD